MSSPQEEQEKGSTSVLKERRFKLSRSVVLSVSQLLHVLMQAMYPSEHAIVVGERILHCYLWLALTKVTQSKEDQM